MGADVMRLLFCAQVPSQNIRFGYGPAREIKRRLLTLWNSVSFFVTYANIEGYRPELRRPRSRTADRRAADARPLARRAHAAARRGDDGGVRVLLDARRHARVRRLRRRSLELVHPALAQALLRIRRGCVPHALVRARPGAARDRPGDAVPRRASLAEPRRRAVRGRAAVGVPGRWPETAESRTVCSTRSRRRAAWSSSAVKHDPRQGSSIASRCGGSSCKGTTLATRTWTRSRRSCASRTSSSATSTSTELA